MRTATDSELDTAKNVSEIFLELRAGKYGETDFGGWGLYVPLAAFDDAEVGATTWPTTTIARDVSYDYAEFHYISYAVRTRDGVRNPFDY